MNDKNKLIARILACLVIGSMVVTSLLWAVQLAL